MRATGTLTCALPVVRAWASEISPPRRPVAGAVVVSVRRRDDASPQLGAVVAVVVEDRKVAPDDCIQPGCHARLQVLDDPGARRAVSRLPCRPARWRRQRRPRRPLLIYSFSCVCSQPYPDALPEGIIDTAPGPDARYQTRETVELAFVAALQHLPPRQRAVLLLRDVLGFHAAEVDRHARDKRGLGQKRPQARAGIDRTPISRVRPGPSAEPNSPTEHELVRRFADAWMADDIDGVVALLTEDAWFTMSPPPHDCQGRSAIYEYLNWRGGRRHELIPQPEPTASQHSAAIAPTRKHRSRTPSECWCWPLSRATASLRSPTLLTAAFSAASACLAGKP